MVLLLPLVVGLLSLGCYEPKVVSGGLKCSVARGACPEGFSCLAGVCVSADAPGGRAGGTGGGAGKSGMAGAQGSAGRGGGGSGGGGGAGAMCANPIQPLCQGPATSSGCDPVCQTGCGCGLRCSLSNAGPGCAAPVGAKTLGQVCQPSADDCAAGLTCLQEACGDHLGRCYRFCRDATMCGATGACAKAVALPNGTSSAQRVCNLADQTCDPYAGTGCPDPALHCYVTGPSHTACDCPSMPGAEGQEGDRCSAYNDCAAGLACLQAAGASRCLRLCRSTADCPTCATLGAVSYCAIAAGG
jgi:hypothetical protein